MFDAKSRYARIPTATCTLPDGRVVPYVLRRVLPQGASLPLLETAWVPPAKRLDQVAASRLGDPEASWRICDANDAMRPWTLVPPTGGRLRIPMPEAGK